MKNSTFLLLVTALLAPLAHGQDRDFDVPAGEMTETLTDGGIELSDADFEGNPLKGFAEKWPDDLVIAPIPGRSPQVGWLMDGRGMLYRKDVGSDFDAETFMVNVNRYIPFRENDVLAVRGYFRTTSGKAPFFIKSTFGGSTDLRGYPSGRYRDNDMYALQAEYRWAFSNMWIFTGFAGFGEVAPDASEFGGDTLPAAGIGTRFVMSEKHKVSISFDVAQGKDGTEYYLGIGEVF